MEMIRVAMSPIFPLTSFMYAPSARPFFILLALKLVLYFLFIVEIAYYCSVMATKF